MRTGDRGAMFSKKLIVLMSVQRPKYSIECITYRSIKTTASWAENHPILTNRHAFQMRRTSTSLSSGAIGRELSGVDVFRGELFDS